MKEDTSGSNFFTGPIVTYMSGIALIISLIAGTHGLYDTFIIKREKEKADAVAQVRATIRRLTEINAMSASAFSTNPEAAIYISQNSNPEKIALLAYTDKVISDLEYNETENLIDAGSYFLLSSEHLNLANAKLALNYAKRAIAAAGDNRAVEAEALRINARALFVPSEIQNREEGRRTYSQARDIVRNFSSVASTQVEINVVIDWMVSEANFGDCKLAKDAARDIARLAYEGGIPQHALSAYLAPIKMASQKTTECIAGIL